MTIEKQLKDLIIERYGAVSKFSEQIGMPNSTIATILKTGVHKANINSIITICEALGISADDLAHDKIAPIQKYNPLTDVGDILYYCLQDLKYADHLTYLGHDLSETDRQDLIDQIEMSGEMLRRKLERR